MPVSQASDFQILVETAVAGTYIAVNDISTFENTSSRDTQRYPVFQRATPYATVSPKETSYSLSGYVNGSDAGQDLLRVHEAANTAARIKILWDGVNGFTQQVLVSSRGASADAEGGLIEATFDLTANADPVLVADGPLP